MFAYKVVVTTITVLLMIVLAWAASAKIERSGKMVVGAILFTFAALLVGVWV